MNFFAKIYDGCISLSAHPKATYYLTANSFIESIFWPIPVDVMLAPMCLAKPHKSLLYAFYATVASVLGAVIAYYLGYYLYDPYIANIVAKLHYEATIAEVSAYLKEWGVVFILIGSFTPLPYKISAICAGLIASQQVANGLGAGQLHIIWFVIVSFFGRGLRFFLIAVLIMLGGEKLEQKIRKYIDILGWLCIILVVGLTIWYFISK